MTFVAMQFSTDAFAARERVAAWREAVGRMVFNIDVEPHSGEQFGARAALRAVPGLAAVMADCPAIRYIRPRRHIDSDDLTLTINLAERARAKQFGREIELKRGDAVFLAAGDCGEFDMLTAGPHANLRIPRAAIASSVTDLESRYARRIAAESVELRLLIDYLQVLSDVKALSTPAAQSAVASHVQDLVVLLLAATRDAAHVVQARGLRAVRLKAIKSDIARHLVDGAVSVGDVALRHRVTPRYIQMLFESEGVTFTDYVAGQRLALAHRRLSDPRHEHDKIATIAFDAGFGALSQFYRAFQRRYGVAPSDVRDQATRRLQ